MVQTYSGRQTKKTHPAQTPCPDPNCTCKQAQPCCKLECFERPSYFCGRLLTDDDLTLEQHYVVEKNKLHNRTLHGRGVVCGLRLTCDSDCCTQIRISEGYAIDECGNDIVVCASQPFDVINALNAMGVLVGKPKKDPCKERQHESDCYVKQCFYVAICYEEEKAEYTTPFRGACSSGPSDCEPTRILEKWSIKLLTEPPKRRDSLQELEERIERCFRTITHGPLGTVLKKNIGLVKEAIAGTETQDENRYTRDPERYTGLLAELRALFLQQVDRCPDPHNCRLRHEIYELHPPHIPGQDANQNEWRRTLSTRFCRLIELLEEYLFDCVTAGVIFPCDEVCDPCCVVLGTVEVANGCVTKVCNCPREYVWSFANFFEVLIADLWQNLTCGPPETQRQSDQTNQRPEKHESNGCCHGIDADCNWFLKLFDAEPQGAGLDVASPVRAMRGVRDALRYIFPVVQPNVFAPAIFAGKTTEEQYRMQRALGAENISLRNVDGVSPVEQLVYAALGNIATSPRDPMLAFTLKDRIVGAIPDFFARSTNIPTVDAERRIGELERQHAELLKTLADLKGELAQKNSAQPPAPAQPQAQAQPPAPAQPQAQAQPPAPAQAQAPAQPPPQAQPEPQPQAAQPQGEPAPAPAPAPAEPPHEGGSQ